MAKINTRYDSILPRLPRDESAAEQRQFNESILKAIEALGINANADIQRLSNSIDEIETNVEALDSRITTLEES